MGRQFVVAGWRSCGSGRCALVGGWFASIGCMCTVGGFTRLMRSIEVEVWSLKILIGLGLCCNEFWCGSVSRLLLYETVLKLVQHKQRVIIQCNKRKTFISMINIEIKSLIQSYCVLMCFDTIVWKRSGRLGTGARATGGWAAGTSQLKITSTTL